MNRPSPNRDVYHWKKDPSYYYDGQELQLDPVERNARIFLRAYQSRHPKNYRGGNLQAYMNWRVAWTLECLARLPPSDYKGPKGDPLIAAARTEATRHAKKSLDTWVRLRELL